MAQEDIIRGLQESLSAEYYAFGYLFQCGHAIKGLANYELYHDFFHKGYEEEFEHFHTIANHLAGNNEEVKIPVIEIPCHYELEEMLTHLYQIEVWAIGRYTRLTKLAEELGDVAMANVFQTLAQAEEEDRQEIVKRFGYEPEVA